MKKVLTILILFASQLQILKAQCSFEFELDEYLYICNEQQLPMNLGESMTIEPSKEPYTYYWDCFYEPFPGSELTLDEFDFLEDPTSQFPNLLSSVEGDTLVFTLTATQFDGPSCSLSISVVTSCWNIIVDGCEGFTIEQGQSTMLCSPYMPCTEPATYQWSPTDYLDEPTAPNPTAAPPIDMTYCVLITDAIGCQSNTCMYVNVGVGVSELYKTSISIFPNPSNENPTFQSDMSISKVEIYDATGRIVHKIKLNSTSAQLNIESVSTGCYFLIATTENGITETLKFLKD